MSVELAMARRAYERGRARTSARRALYVVAPVAAVALAVTGRSALAWLPLTLAVWSFAHWRGGPILRGAFVGLVGGAITYVLPMTILRPCCSADAMATMAAGASCCTMPGACAGVGALLGLALAAFVPTSRSRWHVAGGMVLGVASVAVLRCSTLFLAEALGLLGGIGAGVLAATAARLALGRRREV